MEDNQEEKQNYLRENILNRGYDANIFINFLKTKKGEEGADISNWSMPDLQQVVQEFISLNSLNYMPNQMIPQNQPYDYNQMNPQYNQTNQINQINPQTNEINPQMNQINEQNNQTNEQNNQINEQNNQIQNNEIRALNEEDFGIIIPDVKECKKTEITELFNYKNVEITVSDPKKVDKGFFSKAYIDFQIQTNPCKFVVRRQHAEFVWLRERLSILFNTNVLPRLPKKGKVNGDPHLQKRIRNLERFLNYLVKDPLIKTSQILFDFLSIENEEEFNKRKKIYNKMRTPTDFSEIKSLNGKTRLKITEVKEKTINNIRDNAALNETALKKFNQNFKILREEMNTVISRFLSFSPLFDKLIKISTTFLEDNIIIVSYKQMQNIFNSWADILKRQNSFFCNDIKEYLKIISGNYHHMRDLVQVVESLKTNYYKLSKNLMSKKIDLFKRGDISSWQLDVNDKNQVNEFCKDRIASYKKMCYKDTMNAIKNKEKYGYYLNRLISEYIRMRNINAFENKDKVRQFSKKQGQIMSEYFKIMGEMILTIDGCIINDAADNLYEEKSEQFLGVDNNISQQEIEEEQNQINTQNNENNNNIVNGENSFDNNQ